MKRIPLIANVISEVSLDRPELRIQPRADLAARLGVSTESLSQTIRVATIGDVGPALAKFDAGDRQVPIRVQLEDSARASDLPMLEQLRVPLGEHGEKGGVPLSVVADIKLDQGPTSINRYDRERQATVAADLVGNAALGDATKKDQRSAGHEEPAEGASRSAPSGDAESLNELSEGFATAITARPDDGIRGAGAAVRHLPAADHHPVLAAALDRRRHRRLAVDRQTADDAGVDRHPDADGHRHQERHHAGRIRRRIDPRRQSPRHEAIIDAGMKRARPIVMTTIAMAAGMMPSALAVGAGGEFRSPMALAVIGGLVFSTVLSLVFVPAMFMMMDDLGAFIWRFGKLLLVNTGETEHAPAMPPAERKEPPPPPSIVHSPAAE